MKVKGNSQKCALVTQATCLPSLILSRSAHCHLPSPCPPHHRPRTCAILHTSLTAKLQMTIAWACVGRKHKVHGIKLANLKVETLIGRSGVERRSAQVTQSRLGTSSQDSSRADDLARVIPYHWKRQKHLKLSISDNETSQQTGN